jgi:hypothetical protein
MMFLSALAILCRSLRPPSSSAKTNDERLVGSRLERYSLPIGTERVNFEVRMCQAGAPTKVNKRSSAENLFNPIAEKLYITMITIQKAKKRQIDEP